jgi:protein-serine/threonine kinase
MRRIQAHDGVYYEQQRRELLHKHGIDLEDGHAAPPTRRFDQDLGAKGSDETPGSILTMRDKNRRKLAYSVVGVSPVFF